MRSARLWAGAIVLLLLAIGAVVFSNGLAARQVADDAQLLNAAEGALGTNNLAVKALSQAVLLAEDAALGVANEDTAARAHAEASSIIDELERRTSSLMEIEGRGGEVDSVARSALAAGRNVLELLRAGDPAAAGEYLSADGLAAFERLRDAAQGIRTETAQSVVAAKAVAGRITSIAAFLVAFLIPAGAIVAYRRVARSQLHLAEVELDARLEAEQRIAHAKDEFVANISHELRTPLTSIYGMSDILLEDGIVDPQLATELVGIIHGEATELGRMVEDLLTAARSESDSITFKLDRVDLAEELESVLAPLSRSGTHVDVELDAAAVWADSLRVRQILRNLLSNAQKHGGPAIRVRSQAQEASVELIISDNGPGVPADREARLFTRFVHEGEDPLTTGSVGLGLAVVKALADGMGGDVRYERRDGWTHLVVRLPTAPTKLSSGGTSPSPLPSTGTIAATSALPSQLRPPPV